MEYLSGRFGLFENKAINTYPSSLAKLTRRYSALKEKWNLASKECSKISDKLGKNSVWQNIFITLCEQAKSAMDNFKNGEANNVSIILSLLNMMEKKRLVTSLPLLQKSERIHSYWNSIQSTSGNGTKLKGDLYTKSLESKTVNKHMSILPIGFSSYPLKTKYHSQLKRNANHSISSTISTSSDTSSPVFIVQSPKTNSSSTSPFSSPGSVSDKGSKYGSGTCVTQTTEPISNNPRLFPFSINPPSPQHACQSDSDSAFEKNYTKQGNISLPLPLSNTLGGHNSNNHLFSYTDPTPKPKGDDFSNKNQLKEPVSFSNLKNPNPISGNMTLPTIPDTPLGLCISLSNNTSVDEDPKPKSPANFTDHLNPISQVSVDLSPAETNSKVEKLSLNPETKVEEPRSNSEETVPYHVQIITKSVTPEKAKLELKLDVSKLANSFNNPIILPPKPQSESTNLHSSTFHQEAKSNVSCKPISQELQFNMVTSSANTSTDSITNVSSALITPLDTEGTLFAENVISSIFLKKHPNTKSIDCDSDTISMDESFDIISKDSSFFDLLETNRKSLLDRHQGPRSQTDDYPNTSSPGGKQDNINENHTPFPVFRYSMQHHLNANQGIKKQKGPTESGNESLHEPEGEQVSYKVVPSNLIVHQPFIPEDSEIEIMPRYILETTSEGQPVNAVPSTPKGLTRSAGIKRNWNRNLVTNGLHLQQASKGAANSNNAGSLGNNMERRFKHNDGTQTNKDSNLGTLATIRDDSRQSDNAPQVYDDYIVPSPTTPTVHLSEVSTEARTRQHCRTSSVESPYRNSLRQAHNFNRHKYGVSKDTELPKHLDTPYAQQYASYYEQQLNRYKKESIEQNKERQSFFTRKFRYPHKSEPISTTAQSASSPY